MKKQEFKDFDLKKIGRVRATVHNEEVLFAGTDIMRILGEKINDGKPQVFATEKYKFNIINRNNQEKELYGLPFHECCKLIEMYKTNKKDKEIIKLNLKVIKYMMLNEIPVKNRVLNMFKSTKETERVEIKVSDRTISLSEVAVLYGLSSIKLNEILSMNNLQFREGRNWILTNPNHENHFISYENKTRRWTPEGQRFLHELLDELGFKTVRKCDYVA